MAPIDRLNLHYINKYIYVYNALKTVIPGPRGSAVMPPRHESLLTRNSSPGPHSIGSLGIFFLNQRSAPSDIPSIVSLIGRLSLPPLNRFAHVKSLPTSRPVSR